MKKFLMDVKSAVGTAPKTEDKEFDEKNKEMKEINDALREFHSAVDRMKTSFNSVVTAMESVHKAMGKMTAADDASADLKKVTTDFEASVKKIKDTLIPDYKKALEDEKLKDLNKLGEECKKLSEKREKVRAEYDTYREQVEKDEKKKDKHLAETTARRDELQKEFEAANKEFKEKATELDGKKKQQYLVCMTTFLDATSTFLTSFNNEITTVNKTAKSAKA